MPGFPGGERSLVGYSRRCWEHGCWATSTQAQGGRGQGQAPVSIPSMQEVSVRPQSQHVGGNARVPRSQSWHVGLGGREGSSGLLATNPRVGGASAKAPWDLIPAHVRAGGGDAGLQSLIHPPDLVYTTWG